MKKIIILSALLLICFSTNAQQKKIWDETKAEKKERLAWWTNDRFGMFIHWGTYSLAGRHEWVKNYERTDTRPTKNILTILTLTYITQQNGQNWLKLLE